MGRKKSTRAEAEQARAATGDLPLHVQAATVVLLLAAYMLLAVWNASTTSPTQDEPVHIAAGYTSLAARDYRLNPEHPPLVKMLAALPLVSSGEFRVDPVSGAPQSARLTASRSNHVLGVEWNGLVAQGEYWRLVHELFYGVDDALLAEEGVSRSSELRTDRRYLPEEYLHDSASLIRRARVIVLVFGVILGVLVWHWTREIFGALPALLSLAVYAFDPNFIGHGALVTTDVPAAAAMFSSVYFFWRALRYTGWKNEAASAASIGVAATVKFSTVLLAPILAVIGLVWLAAPHWIGQTSSSVRGRLLRVARLLVVGAGTAYLSVWTVYGFRYSAVAKPDVAAGLEREGGLASPEIPFREPGTLPVEWTLRLGAADRALLGRWPDGAPLAETRRLALRIGLPAADRAILAALEHQLLPEAYLMGLAHVRFASLRGAFLNGQFSNVGFPDYFVRTFLYKTSLPALALIALSLAGVLRGGNGQRRQLMVLLTPVAIYGLVAIRSTLNIGHRHILPVYPFLFVVVGAAAAIWLERSGATAHRRLLAAAGLVVMASFVVLVPPPGSPVPPHHLSYFNEIAGGMEGGHKRLVDSNCDWGQDLPSLAKWVDQNAPDEPIHLCYFGSSDPRAYGISFVNMPGGYPDAPISAVDPRTVTGLVAISVTNLSGATWTSEMRTAWREALAGAAPVGRAGYSILIFRR